MFFQLNAYFSFVFPHSLELSLGWQSFIRFIVVQFSPSFSFTRSLSLSLGWQYVVVNFSLSFGSFTIFLGSRFFNFGLCLHILLLIRMCLRQQFVPLSLIREQFATFSVGVRPLFVHLQSYITNSHQNKKEWFHVLLIIIVIITNNYLKTYCRAIGVSDSIPSYIP